MELKAVSGIYFGWSISSSGIAVDSRLYAIELQFSIFRVVLIVKEVYTLK